MDSNSTIQQQLQPVETQRATNPFRINEGESVVITVNPCPWRLMTQEAFNEIKWA